MQTYIGTKLIKAWPMNRLGYNKFRGWELPSNEDGNDDGYLVEYLDGGKPNVEGRKGYVSWSPKEQFENAYRTVSGMSFGLAIEAMKKGYKVARQGWNGKGMFLFLVQGSQFEVNRAPLLGIYPAGTVVNYQPHIDMKTAQDTVVPWLASQSDVLADDWVIVE
jgi:Protein of unknown function (DUF2829)